MNASLFVLTLASLAAAPQDVLYDFYSTSCGPCQMMMPIVHQLHAEGYPVRTIDVQQRPDLAERFGVQSVPTFVLVIGGQERQRLVGMQDESTLRGLLAQIPQRRAAPAVTSDSSPPPRPRRSLPVRLADDDSRSSNWNFHLPLPSFSGRNQNQEVVQVDPPSPPTTAKGGTNGDAPVMRDAIADATGPSGSAAGEEPPRDDRPAAHREGETRASADPETSKMLASSVRIRVKDANGVYFGSGVVIENTREKTLVLTCGHILRDVKQGSRIEVDVFDGNRSRTYRGSIVKYDQEADLGLVAVATHSPVSVAPIASVEGAIRPGDTVVSIGCSQGELPSVKQLRVTMLNRYLGPDTIECTGVPDQGRSGGGLFTRQGSVVGVCTNADPHDRRGVYAGLKPIHELLKNAGLDDLIPHSAAPGRESLTESPPAKPEPSAAEEPRNAKPERDPDPAPATARAASARRDESFAAQPADEGKLTAKMLEQSEVVCIIRPVNQPHGASRVVIINRASRKFMAYLTGEMKDQLLPAMGHAPRDDGQSASANDTGRSTVNDTGRGTVNDTGRGTVNDPPRGTETPVPDAGDAPRTTAAWKPSTSVR